MEAGTVMKAIETKRFEKRWKDIERISIIYRGYIERRGSQRAASRCPLCGPRRSLGVLYGLRQGFSTWCSQHNEALNIG
jgi:hypothetical protein